MRNTGGTPLTRKRTWTVPILLLTITGLMILLVLASSRLLLVQLEHNRVKGQLLAERYNYALIFTSRLTEGANLLLQGEQSNDFRQAHLLWGEARGVSGEALQLLAEALSRTSGQSQAEAVEQLQAAMETLTGEAGGWLLRFAERDGPLAAPEEEALRHLLADAEAMHEQLKRFRPPTLDAGFRQMAAGVDWVEPAAAASRQFLDLATQLNEQQ